MAEAGGETSPVYMHMARAIRAAESEDDLMAVGEAARDNIAGVSDRERDILRRLFRQRRAAFSRGTPR